MQASWSRAEARRAIKALRDGVPPELSVSRALTVGQDRLLGDMESELNSAVRGGFGVRIIVGNPGAGKSHLLKHIRSLAIARNCLISYSSQDLSSGITLNRPDLVYKEIVKRLGSSDAEEPVELLGDVLSRWSAKALPVIRYKKPTTGLIYPLAEQGLVPPVEQVPRRTRLALVGYVLSRQAAKPDEARIMIGVFQGMKLENREVIAAAMRGGLEKAYSGFTPSNYDDAYWFGQLASFCHIARTGGFGGLVVLLDELESLVDLVRSDSRNKAYRVLQSLFFNKYKSAGMLMVFAFTPAFLTGLEEDVAAGGNEFSEKWRELLQTRSVEIPPLRNVDVISLIGRLASLHGSAFGWDPASAIVSRQAALVDRWRRTGKSVRDLVKAAIHLLDDLGPES